MFRSIMWPSSWWFLWEQENSHDYYVAWFSHTYSQLYSCYQTGQLALFGFPDWGFSMGNILHEIGKRKANWIGHILRRNCLLKQVFEGKIKGEMEVTRKRGKRRKKLLDDLKDRRGYSHLKEEALDRTMWRNRFGGGFGPVVRQNTEWMRALQ